MKKLLLIFGVAALSMSSALAGGSFTATAIGKVDGIEKRVKATITIDRLSTQPEKDEARAALNAGGTTSLAARLNSMPVVGKLIFEDGRAFDLKLTNQIGILGGGRFLTVITAKPISFLGADKPGSKPTEGFGVGVIDLSLQADGHGKGTAAPAAKVKIGDAGGFQVEDYGSKTIWLTDVKRM